MWCVTYTGNRFNNRWKKKTIVIYQGKKYPNLKIIEVEKL